MTRMLKVVATLVGLTVLSTPAFAETLDRSGLTPSFSYEFKDFKAPTVGGPDHQAGPWTTVFGYNPGKVGDHTLPNNSEIELYVDPQFKGNATEPLGLNPFVPTPNGLSIVAAEIAPKLRPYTWGYRYSSGLLTTRKTFSQQFGYFELRARVPSGAGLWPAFWLLPQDGAWPPEIDVFEICCKDARSLSFAAHWTVPDKGHQRDGKIMEVEDLSKDSHLYGVKWTQDRICWYVDDVQKYCAPAHESFATPMYLLINLAMVDPKDEPGGLAKLPATLELDYVKAYTLK